MAQQPAQQTKPEREPVRPMVDEKYGSAARIMASSVSGLVGILKDPSASVYAKAKACQRLAVIGNTTAVPHLAPLLKDAVLSHYARTALEQIPGPAADEALRGALGKLGGRLLVGVINSIGVRRDAAAIRDLAMLRNHEDTEVAKAADEALAQIRPPR